LGAAALALACATGCDIGGPPVAETQGPELHVLGTFPENGAGTDCPLDAPPECGVPRDTPIEIRFDRFLLPKTAIRQSIRVTTGARAETVQPFYDVVERVAVFRVSTGGSLLPGLLYHVELISPKDDENGFGFRAFDGAPLSKDNDVPLRFSFLTARAAPAPRRAVRNPSCFEAWTALDRSGCAKSGCHSGKDAPMGLVLDSGAGLSNTAVGRVAHEADTGPVAGQALVDPLRFGTGMPIVDPGNPATSYLLYKLLVGPDNFGTGCTTKYSVNMPGGGCPTPSAAEQQRLRDWFVPLEPMPFDGVLEGGLETMDLVQRYILAGAETNSCP
jgi:hypothetical protein